MQKLLLSFCSAVALLAYSPLANAAGSEVDRPISLTISPFHLVLPVFELTGEYAVRPDVGVAGILGFGKIDVDHINGDTESFTVFEIGASARYYLIGSFRHGMQIGLEAIYLSVSGDVQDTFAVGDGLSVGPFIGYKFISSFGLTFDLQGGAGYTIVGASASNDEGDTASDSDSAILPIVNINVGWSF